MPAKHRIRFTDKISRKIDPILAAHQVGGNEIKNPHVIVTRSTQVPLENFSSEELEELIAIGRAGAGVDNISLKLATKLGIIVIPAPGQNSPTVAEHVFRLLGNHLRPLSESQCFVKSLAGKTQKEIDDALRSEKSRYKGHDLFGRTLGIIGVGHVGQCVIRIALGYGMRVIGYDIKPSHIPGLMWASSMDEVLRSSDIVSIHVRHTPGVTDGIIGRDQIRIMQPGSILINTARGELVDNIALIEAVHDPKAPLSAYLTDLPMPELIDVEGITCTPHIAASTKESEDRCAESVGHDIDNLLKFGVIQNSVNFPPVNTFPRQGIMTRFTIVHENVEGMIFLMAGVLKGCSLNIADHTTREVNGIAYTLIDLKAELSFDTLEGIKEKIERLSGVLRVRALQFPQ